MNLKHKKIIAREGLIILIIISLMLVSYALPNSYIAIDKDKPIDLLKEKRLKITDTKDGAIYTVIINKADFIDKVEGFTFTQADVLKELGSRGKLESVKGLNVVKKEIPLSSIKENLFIVLSSCYPLWLILRFVFWAKNTLKEKEI